MLAEDALNAMTSLQKDVSPGVHHQLNGLGKRSVLGTRSVVNALSVSKFEDCAYLIQC